MQIRDLIPWDTGRKDTSRPYEESDNPLIELQRNINHVFDDFWGRFDRSFGSSNGHLATGLPTMDVSETDEAVELTVELPGLEEKDIDISLTDDLLTIRGEKKAEKEEKKKGYYLSERSYGSFYRTVPLPSGVDAEKGSATFKNGILTVALPKTPEAQERVRKIEVKAA